MSFGYGKFVGATFGFFTGGPFGALIGFISGSLFDDAFSRMLRNDLNAIRGNPQRLFYRVLYRAMGKLAKADGRVNEQEIHAVSTIMERMGLTAAQRQAAIQHFTEGKEEQGDLAADLKTLRVFFVQSPKTALMFLELLLAVAYADGSLQTSERQFFDWLCPQLGVNKQQFEYLHQRILSGEQGAYQRGDDWQQHSEGELLRACTTLGISQHAEFDEIKRAYRKQMSLHHPDKLMASGASDAEILLAKETTQRIQNAYDYLQKVKR